jgi:hypothetical protein
LKTFDLRRYTTCVSAAVALLAACGGLQPPIRTPGVSVVTGIRPDTFLHGEKFATKQIAFRPLCGSSRKHEVSWRTKDPKGSGFLIVNAITRYGPYETFYE